MKKTSKSKKPQPTLGVDQDIVGLITTLVQKLVSLESKIDTVLNRLTDKVVEAPRQQPVPNAPVQRHNNMRPMYQVVCADCGNHCEVPFKPAMGRAVYCKECFTKRKTNSRLAPRVEVKAPVASPMPQAPLEKSPAAKPVTAPQPKKKPSAKKAKKKPRNKKSER